MECQHKFNSKGATDNVWPKADSKIREQTGQSVTKKHTQLQRHSSLALIGTLQQFIEALPIE